MWIFTRYGFFSTVCARQGNGAYGNAVDLDRVMVRARRREHLEALLERFRETVAAPTEIHESDHTDYRFRIFLPKAVWSEILGELGNDLDYDNFKDAAHSQLDGTPDGRLYTSALGEVWQKMWGIQDD